MPPVRDPMEQMVRAVTQMATAVAQQTAAAAQREVREEERRAQQQVREEAQTMNKGLVDFRRHDPPKFAGEAEPEKSDLWVQEVEKIFKVLQTPEESKVGFAACLLIGETEYWWTGARRIMEANHTAVTWHFSVLHFCGSISLSVLEKKRRNSYENYTKGA